MPSKKDRWEDLVNLDASPPLRISTPALKKDLLQSADNGILVLPIGDQTREILLNKISCIDLCMGFEIFGDFLVHQQLNSSVKQLDFSGSIAAWDEQVSQLLSRALSAISLLSLNLVIRDNIGAVPLVNQLPIVNGLTSLLNEYIVPYDS